MRGGEKVTLATHTAGERQILRIASPGKTGSPMLSIPQLINTVTLRREISGCLPLGGGRRLSESGVVN